MPTPGGFRAEVPELATFAAAPSWMKVSPRTGEPTAVDRSACLAVSVADVRRLAGCVAVNPETGKRRSRAGVLALPGQRAAATRDGRLATGVVEVSARWLSWLAENRPARALRGDYRNTRANAMRGANFVEGPDQPVAPMEAVAGRISRQPDWRGHRNRDGFGRTDNRRRRTKPKTPMDAVRLENVLPANPNAGSGLGPWLGDGLGSGLGAGAGPGLTFGALGGPEAVWGGGGVMEAKVLGLPSWWWHPVRVEQWRGAPGRPVLYFLVCPGCGRRGDERFPGRERAYAEDERFPGLSRIGRGKNSHDSKRTGACPQRVQRLYLPRCTAGEWRDAQLASAWMAGLPAAVRRRPAVRDAVAALVGRYGAFLGPRALRCRTCLGVRDGNHPDVALAGHRRRRAGEG